MSDTTGNALALPNEPLPNEPLPNESPIETAMPAIIPERARDGRFMPGHPANSPGRPRGARNRATIAVESLMEGEAEALSRKMIAAAMGGDTGALKFCLERLSPRLKSRRLDIELPPINTPSGLSDAVSVIVETAAGGEMDTEQARMLTGLLDTKRKCLETVELEERLTLIEKKVSRDRRAL